MRKSNHGIEIVAEPQPILINIYKESRKAGNLLTNNP